MRDESDLGDAWMSTQKKARSNEPSAATAPDLFQTLAHTMHFSIRQQILDLQLTPGSVEVEFRIGMLVSDKRRRWRSSQPAGGCYALQQEAAMQMGVEFIAGVDEAAVGRLRQVLACEGYTGSSTEQRVRTGSTGGLRCVVDDQGRETASETKKKVLRLDLGCVGHQYDARLEVATEVSGNSAGGAGRSGGQRWSRERLKRRTTFVRSAPQPGAWQVDVTAVTTTELGADGTRGSTVDTTELEFELTRPALQQWLDCRSDEDCHKCTSQITTELVEVLNLCVPPTSEEGAAQSGAQKSQVVGIPRSSGVVSEVTRLNGAIISAAKVAYAPDKFLGSMPLNISRRNLLLLERQQYFVTEKSDGVRYLLYVVRTGQSSSAEGGAVTAVFVDRAGNLFRPPGADAIAKGLKAGTVLDGEIVFNMRYEKSIFLVFDILCNEGQPCAQLPFERRSALIAGPLMARVGAVDYKAPEEPLWIIRKKFWPKNELKTLLKHMVHSKGKRYYRESERRYHKSDGLIFQPNTPYVFGTDVTLVKWKWPELASVDLQVEPNRRPGISEPSLMAGGPDGTQVDCCMRGSSHVGMGVFDTYRLLADVEDSSCLVHIAEVAFNTKVGLWSYFQLRKDKSEPNYINTVMSILMEQAEDVNIGELEARVLGGVTVGGASSGAAAGGSSSSGGK